LLMKVSWKGRQYVLSYNKPRKNPSEPHKRAKALLQKIYGATPIKEEVFLPGVGLFLDLFLPLYRLGLEVHGEQHYKQVNFFHKTEYDFIKSKKRDRLKEQFCLENNITLVVLDSLEPEETWIRKISLKEN
jgi:hypothetical protein